MTFDDQFYKAVAGEASWKTADFEEAADRYEIDFLSGVRDLVVETLEAGQRRPAQRVLATVLPKTGAHHQTTGSLKAIRLGSW